jgi:acyl carrier protein
VRIGEVASGPGGIDSLSFIEFMFMIEEKFGIIVSDDDLC